MLKSALMKIGDFIASEIVEQGKNCFYQNAVLSVSLSEGLLKGRVKGKLSPIYNVHLDLKEWPRVASRCGCQKQSNCKHAVACLFALQAKENLKHQEIQNDEFSAEHAIENFSFSEEDPLSWFSNIEDQGHDFFSYELGILVNEKKISIVPLVAELINRYDLLALENLPSDYLIHWHLSKGTKISFHLERIRPLIRLLVQYSTRKNIPGNQALQLNAHELLFLQEAEQALAATKERWQHGGLLQEKLQALTFLETTPVIEPPLGLTTKLRDYQHQGLNWLQALRVNHFAGVLADDMGLGKTLQTLANLLFEKEQGRLKGPSLIIAPTSLMGNWLDEANRFTPDLSCAVFHGSNRHQFDFKKYDVIISTYGLVQRDKLRFLAHHFYYLILDEAQFIKNNRTKTTQIIQQIKARNRLCLTGTPLENHLGELWSLFHFLMPGLLGDQKTFRQYFRNPIEKQDDSARRLLLDHRIKPFMLRRSKNEVLFELPAKTEITLKIELSGTQRDLYEAIRMTMERKVREAIVKNGLGKSQIILLDALLKLRQVCCDPKLLSLPEAVMAHGNSAKLDALIDLLDNLMEEGRSVLVFSQFTSMLKLIEEKIQSRGYRYLKLTGQTKKRHQLVQAFQEGEAPIFLISLKAGGTGLNLTKADTVIHYDPWWNPAVQDQATSRSHRIGQDLPVFVYQLLSAGTVEEVILEIQKRKRRLFDQLLSNQFSGALNLSTEDIAEFFAPLN